jgi:tetratricopeptide (TPR) repeat protein
MFGMLYVLSRRDPRFRGAVDAGTAKLFGYWFVICVVATQLRLLHIGNTAHAVGAALGALLGLALDRAQKGHVRILGGLGLVLLSAISLAGASVLRPYVNFTKDAGLESGQLGYDALGANRIPEARAWFERSVRLSKREPSLWHNLGIVRSRSGDDAGAEAAFAKAVELAPDNTTYRQALDWIRERRARPPEPDQSR